MTDICNHWPFIDDIIKPLEAWWEGDYVGFALHLCSKALEEAASGERPKRKNNRLERDQVCMWIVESLESGT